MSPDVQNPIFNNEAVAREALEAARWPAGPVCSHCDSTTRIIRVEGKKHSHRPGLFYCNDCQGQFTVTVGTIFERSKVPLTKWWLASHLFGSSEKGMSVRQLHRRLGVTYKTAWFMARRIRDGMAVHDPTPRGGKEDATETETETDAMGAGKGGDVFVNGRGWVKRGGTVTT